jgi:hypothetical protein
MFLDDEGKQKSTSVDSLRLNKFNKVQEGWIRLVLFILVERQQQAARKCEEDKEECSSGVPYPLGQMR